MNACQDSLTERVDIAPPLPVQTLINEGASYRHLSAQLQRNPADDWSRQGSCHLTRDSGIIACQTPIHTQ
jgi:hypothetical protein